MRGHLSGNRTPDEEVARLTQGDKTINYYAALKV